MCGWVGRRFVRKAKTSAAGKAQPHRRHAPVQCLSYFPAEQHQYAELFAEVSLQKVITSLAVGRRASQLHCAAIDMPAIDQQLPTRLIQIHRPEVKNPRRTSSRKQRNAVSSALSDLNRKTSFAIETAILLAAQHACTCI